MVLLFSGQAAFREDSKAHVSREVPLANFGVASWDGRSVESVADVSINGTLMGYIYTYIEYNMYIILYIYTLYGVLMKCISGVHNIYIFVNICIYIQTNGMGYTGVIMCQNNSRNLPMYLPLEACEWEFEGDKGSGAEWITW